MFLNFRNAGSQNTSNYMPASEYNKKVEVTKINEDPMRYDNYMRGLLKDFRPDKPVFASDIVPSSNYSTDLLSLRYNGSRSSELPYLPDGTFLDQEFMIKDKNREGMPNMQQHVKHQRARQKFYKFSNDEDHSIHENVMTDRDINNKIKSGYKIFKSHYRNFKESKDNKTYTNVIHEQKSNMDKVVHTGLRTKLSDSQNKNKQINGITEGFFDTKKKSQSSQRSKVAKYGLVRKLQTTNDMPNRESRLDNIINVTTEQNNKAIANMIIDVDQIRMKNRASVEGIEYGKSNMAANRITIAPKIDPEIINRLFGSQAKTPHELLNQQAVNRTTGKNVDNRHMKVTEINHEVLESMKLSNKKLNKMEVKDLRENIIQSSEDFNIYNTSSNKSHGEKFKTSNQTRYAEDNRDLDDGTSIMNYAGFAPPVDNNKFYSINHEAFGSKSQNNFNREQQMIHESKIDVENYECEKTANEFDTFDRADRMKPQNNGRHLQGASERCNSMGEKIGDW